MGFLDRFRRKPPSPDEFAAMVMAALRQAGDTTPVEYDRAQFALRFRTDTNEVVNLNNFFVEYTQLPRQRKDEAIARVVDFRMEPEPSAAVLAEARHRLLPSVRSQTYLAGGRFQRLEAGSGDESLAPATAGTLGGELVILLVLDYPRSIKTLQVKTLEAWGIGVQEALAIAVPNLRARTEGGLKKVRNGVYASEWKDNYDATRILLPEIIRDVKVAGRPVALLPHRDSLLVTGEDDARGLQYLAEQAAASFETHHRVSARPLVLDGGMWRDLEVPASHPARAAFALHRRRSESIDYQVQQTGLTAMFEREGLDVFIATYTLVTIEGRPVSYCIWMDDLPGLLPLVDAIVFTRGNVTIGFAYWSDVQRAAGALMARTDHEPPRWQVESFPSQDVLAAMPLRAVTEL